MRDKELTEAMGLEYIKTIKGGKFGDCIHYCDEKGYDFIIPIQVFFFLLWEWSQTQGWWDTFYYFIAYGEDASIQHMIHPDRFADAVYNFLKERE